MKRVLGNILCNHGSRVKVKSEKTGICDGIPSTAVKLCLVLLYVYLCVLSTLVIISLDALR